MKQILTIIFIFTLFSCNSQHSENREPSAGLWIVNGKIESYGLDKLDNSSFSDSIVKYDNLIKNDPKNDLYYIVRGSLRYYLGETENAMSDFQTAIDLGSAFDIPYHFSAVLLYQKGKPIEAKEYINKAIQLNPNNAEAYVVLGILKRFENDIPGALKEYEKSISISPLYEAFFNKGNLLLKLDKVDEAKLAFEEAIKLNPEADQGYFYLGIINLKFQQPDSALINFNTSIKINPNFGYAYLNKGIAEINLHMPAEACKDFYIAKEMGLPEADGYIQKFCK